MLACGWMWGDGWVSSVGRGGFHSVSFRLPFFGVPFDSFFDESLGEWVAGVEVIGECVGEWDPVNGIRL